jgi:hypothetical protein
MQQNCENNYFITFSDGNKVVNISRTYALKLLEFYEKRLPRGRRVPVSFGRAWINTYRLLTII